MMDPSTWVKASRNKSRKTHLHALVVQLQTVVDTPREHVADLRPVPTLLPTTFHPALLVHDAAFNDAVPNRLPDDVLRVLLRVKVQLHANVSQRDAGIRQGEPSDSSLDNILAQPDDERVRLVSLELGGIG